MEDIELVDASKIQESIDAFYGNNEKDDSDETKDESNEQPSKNDPEEKEEPDDKGFEPIDEDFTKKKEQKSETKETKPVDTGEKAAKSVFAKFAKVIKDRGNLFTDEDIDNVETLTDFEELINKVVDKRLGSQNVKIREALDAGAEPETIKRIMQSQNYLNSIDDKALNDESDNGAQLRRQLIYQYKLIQGFSKEDAIDYVQYSEDKQKDLKDAQVALEALKSFYDKSIEDEKAKVEAQKKQIQEAEAKKRNDFIDKVKDDISKYKSFGDIEIDDDVRQNALDFITVESETSKEGQKLTKFQKYLYEDFDKFVPMFAIFYSMTNGGKSLDKIINKKVKQRTRQTYEDLDASLRDWTDNLEGNLSQLDTDNNGDNKDVVTFETI